MRILFIDNYDSFTYNVVEILRGMADVEIVLKKNDELRTVSIDDFDKMIISPGPDLPAAAGELMWFLHEHLLTIPTLGICLGHQAIVEFFGGSLMQYKNPKHGEKTLLVQQRQSLLFKNLPKTFEVGLYHSWYASADNMPDDLKVTALNNEGIIMAAAHKKLPIYSLQFHPESYMSQFGTEILHNFIRS